MAGIKLFKRLRDPLAKNLFSLLRLDDARPSVGPFYKLTHFLLFSNCNLRISKKPMISQILSSCGAGARWRGMAALCEFDGTSPGVAGFNLSTNEFGSRPHR
jgi:hypothetical protein